MTKILRKLRQERVNEHEEYRKNLREDTDKIIERRRERSRRYCEEVDERIEMVRQASNERMKKRREESAESMRKVTEESAERCRRIHQEIAEFTGVTGVTGATGVTSDYQPTMQIHIGDVLIFISVMYLCFRIYYIVYVISSGYSVQDILIIIFDTIIVAIGMKLVWKHYRIYSDMEKNIISAIEKQGQDMTSALKDMTAALKDMTSELKDMTSEIKNISVALGNMNNTMTRSSYTIEGKVEELARQIRNDAIEL